MKKLILILIISLFLLNGCIQKEGFEVIKECIIDVETIYNSDTQVQKEGDVLTVSNEFISWSKENKDSKLWNNGSDWKIENIEIHGSYKGIKYWTVTYSYSTMDNQNYGRSQFDVNEKGKVVLFLGCV